MAGVTSLRREHLLEQLTERLRRQGFPHPAAAAAALAARGEARLDPDSFARRSGVDVDLVLRAEAGLVSVDELPPGLHPPPTSSGPEDRR